VKKTLRSVHDTVGFFLRFTLAIVSLRVDRRMQLALRSVKLCRGFYG
jgi:hypothetical protein